MDRFLRKPPAGSTAAPPPRTRDEEEEEDEEEVEDDAEAPPTSEDDEEEEPLDDEEEEEEIRVVDPRFAKRPAAASTTATPQRSAVATPARPATASVAPASSSSAAAERAEQARRLELQRDAAIADARRVRHGGGGRRYSDEDEEDEDDDDYDEDDEEEDDRRSDEDEDVLNDDAEVTRKYKMPKLKFDLSTFSGAFDAGAFVSDLTRDLFAQQSSSADFEPAPFQALFDSALARLHTLRDETDRNILTCAERARRAEEAHKDGLANMHEQMATVLAKFRRLDGRISSVAHTAVRIGHTLHSVDQQKRFNLQAQEIIAHFLAFNSADDRSKLPAIFSTKDPQELHRAAELIQTLASISEDLHIGAPVKRATDLIKKVCEDIEKELLARFYAAAEQGQLMEMKACAKTLLNFPNKSIIQGYVFKVRFKKHHS
jgi:hypothetical protein